MIVLQGGVSGAVMPAAIALLWEAMGRGSDESRRGLALSMAFGRWPAAGGRRFIRPDRVAGRRFIWTPLCRPRISAKFHHSLCRWCAGDGCRCHLFAVFCHGAVEREQEREPVSAVIGLLIGIPLMLVSVALLQLAALPAVSAVESTSSVPRVESFLRALGTLSAIGSAVAFIYHFRSVLEERILLSATLVTILVYAGNVIPSNMNLYSLEALGDLPEKYAGVQNMLRFSFKVVAGRSSRMGLDTYKPESRHPCYSIYLSPCSSLGDVRHGAMVSGRVRDSRSWRIGGCVCPKLHRVCISR